MCVLIVSEKKINWGSSRITWILLFNYHLNLKKSLIGNLFTGRRLPKIDSRFYTGKPQQNTDTYRSSEKSAMEFGWVVSKWHSRAFQTPGDPWSTLHCNKLISSMSGCNFGWSMYTDGSYLHTLLCCVASWLVIDVFWTSHELLISQTVIL